MLMTTSHLTSLNISPTTSSTYVFYVKFCHLSLNNVLTLKREVLWIWGRKISQKGCWQNLQCQRERSWHELLGLGCVKAGRHPHYHHHVHGVSCGIQYPVHYTRKRYLQQSCLGGHRFSVTNCAQANSKHHKSIGLSCTSLDYRNRQHGGSGSSYIHFVM